MVEKFINIYTNALAAPCGSGDATITVTNAGPLPSSGTWRILIDNEILIGTATSGSVVSVERGQEGTTAASHLLAATVENILTAGALEQFEADVEAAAVAAAIAASPSVTGTGLWSSISGVLQPAAITLSGDVSQSGTSLEVTGLLTHVLPSLTVGYLQWTGSAWVMGSGGSTSVTGLGLWYSVSGVLNSAAITLAGDVSQGALSGSSVPLEVTGLLNHALPSLTVGFLEWTGSAWAFGAGGGTSITGTGLWYSVSGTLNSSAIVLDGDVTQGALTGSNVPIEVTGLLSHALPSVAAGFLQWTGSAWAFGTPSGTFGTSNVLYVATNGNDTTGNGSPAAPYATYGNAATVAVGLGAAAGNLFVVLFAPGSYSENIVLVPWVTISGIDAGSSALLNGTITISSAWAGSLGVTSIISNCDVLGAVNINSLAFGASGLSGVQFTNCSIFNNVTSDGTGAANFQVLFVDCVFDACAMVMSDVQLITFGCNFYDDGSNSITLSAPTFGANWTSYGGEFSTDLTVHGATGHTSVVDLVGTSVKGSVTLNGTLATYGSTLSGIPGGGPPILTGGATSAQYTISGIVPVANLSTSTNGNVLTMVAGVPTWSAPFGGTSVTGTGLWYSASGALNAAAITLDGDVTMGSLSGSNVPLTVTQAQGGLFEFGSGGAIFWANGVTPVLSQAGTTGTTGAPFNIDPQQSSNANGSGGSVVVNLQVPNGTGAESHFEVIRGASVVLQAGYGSGATAGMACLWMNTPTSTNPVMYENAGDTFINATSNVQIAISTTSEFYLSTVGTSLFGVGADFGNGVGMLSIGPCTTPPTTTAGTSFMLYYDNSTDAGLVGVGPNTSAFVRETIAGVYGGTIDTQNGVIIRRGLTIRTTDNTPSTFNLANVSSGNAIYVEVWAWGKFVTGSFGAYVGHAEALFVNGGTLNVISSTTLFNSNAGVTIGFTAGGTSASCTLTGEAGNTVDWTVSYTIREA